jgi:hypothetical protein
VILKVLVISTWRSLLRLEGLDLGLELLTKREAVEVFRGFIDKEGVGLL